MWIVPPPTQLAIHPLVEGTGSESLRVFRRWGSSLIQGTHIARRLFRISS